MGLKRIRKVPIIPFCSVRFVWCAPGRPVRMRAWGCLSLSLSHTDTHSRTHTLSHTHTLSLSLSHTHTLKFFRSGSCPGSPRVRTPALSPDWQVVFFFFFVFTLGTGPRRSVSLKPSDARVYEPQMRLSLWQEHHAPILANVCLTLSLCGSAFYGEAKRQQVECVSYERGTPVRACFL